MIRVQDYKPRTTTPVKGNKYYTMTAGGGYSTCKQGKNKKGLPAWNYSVLNNCVGLVWGMNYEESGQAQRVGCITKTAKKPTSAAYWYGSKVDGCERGQVPKLGAIACWQTLTNGKVTSGHVAKVVKTDGTNAGTWVAESGYNSNVTFRLHNYGKNMYRGVNKRFQGYIYPNWIDYNAAIPVGALVKIVAKGNSRADGKGKTVGGVGWKRYVLAYDEKAEYPYKVGSKKGVVTGYYKAEALKEV